MARRLLSERFGATRAGIRKHRFKVNSASSESACPAKGHVEEVNAVSALASTTRAAVLCAILSALYGLLYIILNAEDYALLIGSILLFAALAATMFVTRKINWYALASAPAG